MIPLRGLVHFALPMTQRVRTRFAPSPTGFIHLGNIRSALYPWAFARKMKGDFILRIEDTDVERSSQEAVDVILEAMDWLEMDIDEGPFYQMQRMDRYREVIAQMVQQELVYPCYMSTEELDALRDAQRERGEKPRYDGTWRPEPGKVLPTPPAGVQPVMRFKNPIGGSVVWDDAVKGRIEISNDELDDLVIARPDGTPTYNFCVVVDDMDMQITHVIRRNRIGLPLARSVATMPSGVRICSMVFCLTRRLMYFSSASPLSQPPKRVPNGSAQSAIMASSILSAMRFISRPDMPDA